MLAMVLFLLISLTLVSLESARVSALHTAAAWNLQSSLQAVLGRYYEPLFREYSIYGLYEDNLGEELQNYLSATANPQKKLVYNTDNSQNSSKLNYEIREISVTNKTSLLDGGGKIIRRQMMEAGALDGIAAVAEELLDAVNLINRTSEITAVMEEVLTVEQQLSYMDQEVILLMQAIDGAPVGMQGFVVDSKGNLVSGVKFLKRLVPGEVTQEKVGVNHRGIYGSLEEKYVDGLTFVDNLLALKRLAGNSEEDEKKFLYAEKELTLLLNGCLDASKEALYALSKLLRYQENIQPMVEKLEQTLNAGRALLGESVYAEYLEELSEMKKYVGLSVNQGYYDFVKMRQVIGNNQRLLREMLETIENCRKPGGTDWESGLGHVRACMENYRFDGLTMDYSQIRNTVMVDDSGGWAQLCEFILEGIDGYLFLDQAELSNRVIISDELPSKNLSGSEKTLYRFPKLEKKDLENNEFLEKYLTNGAVDGIRGFLSQSASQIGEKLLLLAYMYSHFDNYLDESEQGVVRYQQEYLVFGAMKDAANAREAALSILGMRTVMNLAYAFTDGAMAAEATAYATELVGGLGMPFLIAVCRTVILFACAIQNALLETIELLQGKAVPFLVSGVSIQIRISEILSFSKTMLRNRAGIYRGGNGFSLSYDHYLLLFMLTVKEERLCGRAMDLIQENMRLYYDPDFRLSECLHSFGVTVTAEAPAVFTNRTFSERWKGTGIQFQEKSAIGY